MSERPTDTQPSRAAAAHGQGRDARAGGAGPAAHAGAGRQSVAERAANFRQGAPFLVERATLYDPEPLDYPDPPAFARANPAPAPRRLLPAALTLLGVVVVVGLAASILFVRNADVARQEEGAGRIELFSDRARPPEGPGRSPGPQPNATTVAYDLTRRPDDAIFGAWRSSAGQDGQSGDSKGATAAPRRRPMPHRSSLPSADMAPEAVTRPVAAAQSRYDAPEPKRRIADGEHPQRVHRQALEKPEAPPASSPGPLAEDAPADAAERPGANVVARVGRASEPLEADGPPVEIPLDKLALPLRRPDPALLGEPREGRGMSTRARRARLLNLHRQQRRAAKRDPGEIARAREATFGDWFVGTQRHRP